MSNDTPDTPRLASSFPETPARPPNHSRTSTRSFRPLSRRASPASSQTLRADSTTGPSSSSPLPPTISPVQVQSISDEYEPLIPLNVLDAPTQRLYAIAIFGALQAYKFYDLSRLYADDGEITVVWFYMKWFLLDAGFFWYLPIFKVPWLRFRPSVSLYCILSFVLFDFALPHISSAPFATMLAGAWKLLYDRELSISERRVKWGDIIHNDTHIMGKYTVHILPEGVAKLNPEGHCFCLGPSSPTVTVPIKINGTQPINIQLTRIDLEGATVDTMNLSQKEIKKLISKAAREETPGLRYLPYTIKQPGLYRLTKVRDVSELDVRVHSSHALVVACPKATIKMASGAKKDVCMNDMSNLSVQLEGLAPLSVTYSRVIRGKPTTLSVGRIHPENYDSPLLSGFSIDTHLAEHEYKDLATWAKRKTLSVPLNDSMTSTGDWLYEIDQVTDGCGNLVDYKAHQEEGDAWLPKFSGLGHKLVVHDRPVIRFDGCDPQNPLALPRGRQAALPLRLESQGADAPYRLKFDFTPSDQLGSSTEHSTNPQVKEFTMKSPSDYQWIKEPGLYSIRKASSSYCSGDVLEPASCLVITPPEPSVTMEHDEILDKCTKSSIGLNLDLTLVGSPPFTLSYREIKDNRPPVVKTVRIDRTRHQVRFTPEEDGHYTYEFFSLSDKNYNAIKIDPATHRIVQTVKPIAGAHFINLSGRKTACIDEPVEFDVKMQGAAPLTLHYDLIHGGRRTRISDRNITEQIYTIKTPPLSNGGEYSLALTSVEDQSGCKVFLESEAKIKVRFQRPKAQFSPVESKMAVRALEGKAVKIPLRLTGEGVSDLAF
jgi:nucleoporin POM152